MPPNANPADSRIIRRVFLSYRYLDPTPIRIQHGEWTEQGRGRGRHSWQSVLKRLPRRLPGLESTLVTSKIWRARKTLLLERGRSQGIVTQQYSDLLQGGRPLFIQRGEPRRGAERKLCISCLQRECQPLCQGRGPGW